MMDCDIYRRVPPTIKSCFCCSSKTGGRIIGWLQMIYGSILLALGLFAILESLIASNFEHMMEFCTLVFVGGIFIALSVLLLKGINKDRLKLVRYWLISQTSICIVDVVLELVFIFAFYDYYGQYISRVALIILCIIGSGTRNGPGHLWQNAADALLLFLRNVENRSADHRKPSSVFLGVYGVLNTVASMFLLRGVNQEKPLLVRIWLITQLVLTAVSFVVWMVIISLSNYYQEFEQEMNTIFLLISEGVQIYCILVVSSYYSKTLGEVVVGSQLDDRPANI